MTEENPYSAPMSPFTPVVLSGGANQGIWRDGKSLVVHRQAVLPPICVKTNEPSQPKIRRKYYWHHPAVYLAMLIHPLIYIILALIIRKKHRLEIPISDETRAKRRGRIAIGWMLALAAIALFIGSIYWLNQSGNPVNARYGVIGIVLACIMLITGLIIGSRAAGILFPKKMTPAATWLKGVNLEYLERFPEIPPHL